MGMILRWTGNRVYANKNSHRGRAAPRSFSRDGSPGCRRARFSTLSMQSSTVTWAMVVLFPQGTHEKAAIRQRSRDQSARRNSHVTFSLAFRRGRAKSKTGRKSAKESKTGRKLRNYVQ